jgi:hypothetical protein
MSFYTFLADLLFASFHRWPLEVQYSYTDIQNVKSSEMISNMGHKANNVVLILYIFYA